MLKKYKSTALLFISIQLLSALSFAADVPFFHVTTEASVLRDARLENPINIPEGSKVSIQSHYLRDKLGTATPTQDQIQRLLLNPGEASRGRISTRRFYHTGSRTPRYDYFFPVTITLPSGEEKVGAMALQYYNRSGQLEIRRTDGADPSRFQSAETTQQIRSLVDDNKPAATEAAVCTNCDNRRRAEPVQDLQVVAERAQADSNERATNNLWQRYQTFAREFASSHRVTRANAGQMKRTFVRSLISRFGAAEAGVIMTALTGYAEAPHRNSNNVQMAEIAAVIKVVENRASSKFSRRSRTLRDIGVSVDADARLTNVLADWQFSVWNDRDQNLVRILSYHPERSDSLTRRKMQLAFESQQLMKSNRITFSGDMNSPTLRHYHANYVNPSWRRAGRQVQSAIVNVNGSAVNLGQQSGSRHIFYTGVR